MKKCVHRKEKKIDTCSVNGRDYYCVKCLWEFTKNKPIVTLRKKEFLEREENIQWEEGRWVDLKKNSENEHVKRVEGADLCYPILVCRRVICGYSILDGCHRFLKSKNEVRCRVVEWRELEKLVLYRDVKTVPTDDITVLEMMIERVFKGHCYWLKGIKHMFLKNEMKHYKCAYIFMRKKLVNYLESRLEEGINLKRLQRTDPWEKCVAAYLILLNDIIHIPTNVELFEPEYVERIVLNRCKMTSLKRNDGFMKGHDIFPYEHIENIFNNEMNQLEQWKQAKQRHKVTVMILYARKHVPSFIFHESKLKTRQFLLFTNWCSLHFFFKY